MIGMQNSVQKNRLTEYTGKLSERMAESNEDAKQSCVLAKRAATSAEDGNRLSGDLGKIMSEIEVDSNKITDAINTINQLALQIQILSINAKVEAAHLGEKGKGFSIVAHEMRSLAETTEESNSKVMEMLGHFSVEVSTVSKRINQTRKNLTELTKDSSNIGKLAEQIEIAFEQINGSMGNATNDMNAILQRGEKVGRSIESDVNTVNGLVNKTSMSSLTYNKLAKKSLINSSSSIKNLGEAVANVNDLAAKAQEISDTVKIVTQISHKAHMLSLNAAIESARVGSQGKAFAVLAGEMRVLSEAIREEAMSSSELLQKSIDLVGQSNTISEELTETVEVLHAGTELVNTFTGKVHTSLQTHRDGVKKMQEMMMSY
jgi:methyl-accepting chemotaxis protein